MKSVKEFFWLEARNVKIVLSFCFGIGAILALIDFVRILTDKYEVNPDKAF